MSQVKARNIAELYKEAAERFGNSPAFCTRDSKKVFQPVTFGEVYEMGLNLATGLIDLGVQQREHVGLLADNRLEWIVTDCAIQCAGAADVPRGTDVTEQDITYIIPHSDAKVVFVEHKAMLDTLQKCKSQLPNVKHIIMMDKETRPGGDILHMYDLMEKGKQLRANGDRRAEERMAAIQPDDLFTLIYTSGTTGAPKGVMLMHRNMISQVKNLPLEVGGKDRALSILPIWHVFERVFEMLAISTGMPTYYSNIRNIRDDMAIIRPTFMASAPRLWENVYLGIKKKVESGSAVLRGLFAAAYFCARMVKGSWRFLTFKQLDMEGRNPIASLFRAIFSIVLIVLFLLPYLLLDFIVLRKLRGATGGSLRGSVSGGGALPFHVDEFFNNIGIPVLEGYGMTETSPVLAVRTYKKLVIGSVGPIYPETEMRLIDLSTGNAIYPPQRGKKGEIHVKGPQVMKGYYKNPEATDKVLKDGWMNTGDLGVITFNNTVKIVGRSKETVVLLGGENVEPVPIENKLLQSPLVEHCMVVGQDKKYLTALIVPSPDAMKEYGATHEEIARSKEALEMMREEAKTLISGQSGFKSFERVIDVRLLPKPFEVGDELTNLFKVKRHLVTDKYSDLIESMYD
ncbi:MAG: long-chain fatty acid--CoA ligase [Spirochaetales bacterium]|nr:long-chain fatty acid--CoA ligase [Leptospiraceae bacterium]MCP5479883.1 long-chain fatty acid--CoA ligase [Spirochaetales bacterium]MCP5486273.1 long-chain fatty acid--CoA ligase [Spirochaetales bacterium]